MLTCICVYIKINGVTSTCTKNNHTPPIYTYHTLYLCVKHIQSVKHNNFYVHIAHIYGYVCHINNIIYVIQIVRSKSYWMCPSSDEC